MKAESAVYERNPEFIFRRIVDELVLVPIRQDVADMDCIYTMNPVAAFIWEKLDGKTTLPEIEAALISEYDVDRATAAADLEEFVQQLESASAIRKV